MNYGLKAGTPGPAGRAGKNAPEGLTTYQTASPDLEMELRGRLLAHKRAAVPEGKVGYDYADIGRAPCRHDHFGWLSAPSVGRNCSLFALYTNRELVDAGCTEKGSKSSMAINFRTNKYDPIIDAGTIAFMGQSRMTAAQYITTGATRWRYKDNELFALNFAKDSKRGRRFSGRVVIWM